MKQKTKTRGAVIMSIVMLVALSIPMVVFADTTVQSYSNGSHTFSSSWNESKTITYSGATCVLTYGFNTTLINEDYAYAYTNGDIHRSRIVNGNGTHNGPWKAANVWSDKEVVHSGNSITYRHIWQD